MAESEDATPPVVAAGVASAEDGHVILDGPDGVAITFSPQAAIDTAASLVRAAEEARAQAGR